MFFSKFFFGAMIIVFLSCNIYAQGILDMKIEKSLKANLVLNLDMNETYESIFVSIISDKLNIIEVNKVVQNFDGDSPFIYIDIKGKALKVFLDSTTIIPLEINKNTRIVKVRGYYYNSTIGYSRIFESEL